MRLKTDYNTSYDKLNITENPTGKGRGQSESRPAQLLCAVTPKLVGFLFYSLK